MTHHDEIKLEDGSGQKTLKSYMIGFVVSLLLTLMAFGLTEIRLFTGTYLYVALGILAIAQLVAQSVFFLRLNGSAEGKWNLFPFLFTLFVIVIISGGSIWIMENLNANMAM
jgi:cytochrome o ubiquinol oxidase subunit IV